MLDFAGLFSHFPRTAVGLQAILNEHFGVPIQVLQFQGQWLNLEPEDRSCLGGRGQTGTSNNRLGGNAVLGEEVWDVESRFRIKIGPLQTPSSVLPLPSDRVGRRPKDPSATGAGLRRPRAGVRHSARSSQELFSWRSAWEGPRNTARSWAGTSGCRPGPSRPKTATRYSPTTSLEELPIDMAQNPPGRSGSGPGQKIMTMES